MFKYFLVSFLLFDTKLNIFQVVDKIRQFFGFGKPKIIVSCCRSEWYRSKEANFPECQTLNFKEGRVIVSTDLRNKVTSDKNREVKRRLFSAESLKWTVQN